MKIYEIFSHPLHKKRIGKYEIQIIDTEITTKGGI